MSAQDRLDAFFAETRGPAVDPAFATAVAERIARRELTEGLAVAAAAALAIGVGLWACAPALEAILAPVSDALAPGIAVLAVTATLLAVGPRLLRPA